MINFWKSNIKKRYAGIFSSPLATAAIFYEKLSFKTQLKIEFLWPYTDAKKCLKISLMVSNLYENRLSSDMIGSFSHKDTVGSHTSTHAHTHTHTHTQRDTDTQTYKDNRVISQPRLFISNF